MTQSENSGTGATTTVWGGLTTRMKICLIASGVLLCAAVALPAQFPETPELAVSAIGLPGLILLLAAPLVHRADKKKAAAADESTD